MKKTFPLKTPLRYPGGKSKAVKTLSEFYPSNFDEYREPFIGGGSMAVYTAQLEPSIPIWINDLYVPLYNFWVQLRDNGNYLYERIRQEKLNMLDRGTQEEKDKFARELFNKYQEEIDTYEDKEKAVAFFIINKCSFSGLTENSTYSASAANSNFSLAGANLLLKFSNLIKNWKITNTSYENVMNSSTSFETSNVFVFLDPPYDIKDFLYGKDRKMHKGFDHIKFAENVYKCPYKFMITYNLNDSLLELYKNYECREWELRYSMAHRGEVNTKDNVKTELLVTNYLNSEKNSLEKLLYD